MVAKNCKSQLHILPLNEIMKPFNNNFFHGRTLPGIQLLWIHQTNPGSTSCNLHCMIFSQHRLIRVCWMKKRWSGNQPKITEWSVSPKVETSTEGLLNQFIQVIQLTALKWRLWSYNSRMAFLLSWPLLLVWPTASSHSPGEAPSKAVSE